MNATLSASVQLTGELENTGSLQGLITVVPPQRLESGVSVKSGLQQQIVTPSEGYTGLQNVTVEALSLETVNVVLSSQAQTINPGSGYDGIGEVNVPAVSLQSKTVTLTIQQQVIEPDTGYNGLSSVTVPALNLENVTVKSGTTQDLVFAGVGYDGINRVIVSPIELQSKTVTLTSQQQIIEPDNGYDGLSAVTVPAASNLYDFELKANAGLPVSIPQKFFRNQIGMRSFKGGSDWNSVTIGTMCFDGCSNLESVELPYVEKINADAFVGCNHLTDVYVGLNQDGNIPTLSSGVFSGYVTYIHVPASKLPDFQNATNWSSYASKMIGDYTGRS